MNTGLIAANKSNSSKDVRGSSPEVMEMNVDLLSMGSADAASSAPTNASSAHGPFQLNIYFIIIIIILFFIFIFLRPNRLFCLFQEPRE